MAPMNAPAQSKEAAESPAQGESFSPATDALPLAATSSRHLKLPSPTVGLPQRTPRLVEPSIFDNNFASPSQHDKRDSVANSICSSRTGANSPLFFVDTAEGNRRLLGDEDYKHQGILASDSGESDTHTDITFESIKTVENGGLADYEPHGSKRRNDEENSPSSSETSSPTLQRSPTQISTTEVPTKGSTSAGAEHALEGVGTFAPVHVGTTASSEELSNLLDAELKPAKLIETLDDEIRRAMVNSAFNDTEFLPLDGLCSIISKVTVRKLIECVHPDWGSEKVKACTRDICGPGIPSTGRRKLLAILILINKVEYIGSFIEAGVHDLDLPLEIQRDEARRFRLYKREDEHFRNPLPYCCDWTTNDVISFKTTQSMMLAPYLNLPQNEIYFYKLSKNYTLPFTVYERKAKSNYGRVMKISIHPAHHNLNSGDAPAETTYFALKALYSHDPADFKKEVDVLQKFSGANKPNPHLIRLLLAFRHGETHYLLFNWADGDLKHFWSSHPKVAINRKNVRWVVEQCLGLAKALQKIHRATSDSWPSEGSGENEDASHLSAASAEAKDYGRHGDIKPENILWFAKQGRLVITDFGLTRYHTFRSKSHDPNENLEGLSPTYRPPECDMRKEITPRYDVWALGCVFLEFISWFILDNDQTERVFARERVKEDVHYGHVVKEDKFFNVEIEVDGRRCAHVKKSVKMWIQRLHAEPQCPEFAHKFLDLIEDHLLVPESSDRWQCARIVQELTNISDRCRESHSYCTKGEARRISVDGSHAKLPEPLNAAEDELDAAQHSVPVLDHFDQSFPQPKTVANGTTPYTSDFAGQGKDLASQDECSTGQAPGAELAGTGTMSVALVNGGASSTAELERLVLDPNNDPCISVLDREDDESMDFEDTHLVNHIAENGDKWRSGDGTVPPTLAGDDIFRSSQGSGDARGNYSADTTPPSSSQVFPDAVPAPEHITAVEQATPTRNANPGNPNVLHLEETDDTEYAKTKPTIDVGSQLEKAMSASCTDDGEAFAGHYHGSPGDERESSRQTAGLNPVESSLPAVPINGSGDLFPGNSHNVVESHKEDKTVAIPNAPLSDVAARTELTKPPSTKLSSSGGQKGSVESKEPLRASFKGFWRRFSCFKGDDIEDVEGELNVHRR